MDFFFLENIYLQHAPLHSNTTCSSLHSIHLMFFWYVIIIVSRFCILCTIKITRFNSS